jgi:hypothetical protein
MHRKRKAPMPVKSARLNANAKDPMPGPPEIQNGDATLLALERQFEALAREFGILRRTSAAQDKKGKGDHGYAATSGNTSNPSGGSRELAPVGDGTERPTEVRSKDIEAALARLEPIERAIMATPAQTVVGLGVKARHAAYVISEYWAEPLEEADWDRRAVRLLIDAVCVVAGRPLAISDATEP